MDEQRILELYLNRDERAVFETNEAYGRRLFQLAMRILENYEDAEECQDDTYLRAWETIPPVIPDYLYGYLAAICRNLSLNRLRFRKTEKRNGQLVELTREMEECIPDLQNTAVVEADVLGELLTVFLKNQKKEARMIFVRRYWFGDPTSDIAARFGLSDTAVRKSLERTRKKLKKYLKEEGISI